MSSVMQRASQSEPDLVKSVRRTARKAMEEDEDRMRSLRRGASDISRCSGPMSSVSGRSRSRLSSSCSSMSRGSQLGGKPMTVGEMQEQVLKAAQDRYIAGLETEAKDAIKNKAFVEKKVKDGFAQDKVDLARKRALEKQNQVAIRSQVQDNKAKGCQTRRDFIAAASAHEFPLFTETFIDADEVEEYRHQTKVNWRQELNVQQAQKKMLNNIVEIRDREQAHRVLHNNAVTTFQDRNTERNRGLAIGAHLRDAWDREIKLNELKKEILKGNDVVKDILSLPQPKALDPSYIRRAN